MDELMAARNSSVGFSNVKKRVLFQVAIMLALSSHNVPATTVNVAEYAWQDQGHASAVLLANGSPFQCAVDAQRLVR
jgi:hypothetical protein